MVLTKPRALAASAFMSPRASAALARGGDCPVFQDEPTTRELPPWPGLQNATCKTPRLVTRGRVPVLTAAAARPRCMQPVLRTTRREILREEALRLSAILDAQLPPDPPPGTEAVL